MTILALVTVSAREEKGNVWTGNASWPTGLSSSCVVDLRLEGDSFTATNFRGRGVNATLARWIEERGLDVPEISFLEKLFRETIAS